LNKIDVLRLIFTCVLIIFSGVLFAQIPSYVPTNGLVGWWPFDGNANDYSGNGNNGVVNGPTLSNDRFNNPNASYYFSGSGCATRIDINNFNYAGAVNSFSISFWIKRVDNGCISPRLFEFGNGTGWGVNWINGNNNMDWVTGLNIPNGTWFHLVYVIQPGLIKSYVNGALNSQYSISNSIPAWFGSNVCFGRMNHPAYDAFNGNLDDVGTWNVALTDCQIQQLYLSQVSPITVNAGPDQTVCSGSPVILTATGASTYTWTGGVQNGVSFIPTASGQYIVTGTNATGCTDTDTVNVNVIPSPVITVTNDTLCAGQSTTLSASITTSCGNLSGSLTNGLVGYWPFCGNANDESGNGNHGTVFGANLTTDRFGNANRAYSFDGSVDSIRVSSNSSLQLTPSLIRTIQVWFYSTPGTTGALFTKYRNGQIPNSSIFIGVSGQNTLQIGGNGSAPFPTTTYIPNQWNHLVVKYNAVSNGACEIFLNGVFINTVTFPNNTAFNSTAIKFGSSTCPPNDPNCNFFTGKLDDIGFWNRALTTAEIQQLFSLGQANYSWSPGGATTPSITVSPNSSTTYTCTVTYPNGTSCTSSQLVVVNNITVNAGLDQTVCSGSPVTLTATGASTYTWTGGVQNGVSFIPTASGQYIVTGTNATGCTDTDTVNVNINPPIIVTATVTNNLCGNASGSIQLSVTGGTAPYTYLWSNAAVTQNLLNIGPGTYIVQITDANGCQLSDTFQVQQSNSMTLTSNIVNPTCSNLANGSIDISIAGGTPPFVYSWSNNASTQDISNLVPGNYTLTVTDDNGCVQNGTYVLVAPNTINITFNSNTIGCYGAAVGLVTSTVSGGVLPYSYSWNNGATTSNLTNVTAGNYTLTVNDAGGCSESESVTIQQPNQFVLSAALTNVNCNGQNSGAINLTATGGTLLYTYNWNNGLFTTQDISNLVAGNYAVTITDGNGCVYDSTFTITQPNQALQLQTSQVNLNCQNGNNGFVDLSVTGGVQPYTYLWSGGEVTQDIFNLSAGLYSVTVTDQNGCTESTSITITEPPTPFELTANISDVICLGSATGNINLSVSGGMAPYTYIWSNNATTQDLTNVTAGTYNVVVLDANGCQANGSFVVSEPTFALQASYQVVNVACSSNETGSIDVSTIGGVAPYVFLWNTGASTEDLSNLGAGNYSLTITDDIGCQLSLSINIQAPSSPLQTNSVVTNVSCYGENDGEINLVVSGGNIPYTFLWSSGQNTSFIDSLIAGNYSVVVTDANGCENNLTIPVSQPSMINTNFGVSSNFVCIPQEVTFNYSINDPTLSFEWDFGNGNTSTLQNPTVIFDNAGCFTITLTVSSANGCSVSSIQDSMICAVVGPTADFYSSTNVIDYYTGELQLFDDSEGSVVGYEWSFGDTSPNTTEENPVHYFPSAIANSYLVSLVVTDTNGCTDSIDQIFELIEDFNIYVPNTITINGDELNEVFLPIFSNVDLIGDYQLQIFNRWGQLVWSTTEPAEGWDGRYKGNKSVQQGTYTWKLKYTNNLMITRTLAGHVTILR
jgi:gliding motility-associated-like protein